MSKTTTKQYKDYSKILKADKDRVLAEIDIIKKEAINTLSEATCLWIAEIGLEKVLIASDVFYSSVPYLQDKGFDITDTGSITIKTLEGSCCFKLRDIVTVEKRIKSQYPASISKLVTGLKAFFNGTPLITFRSIEGKFKTLEQVLESIDQTISVHEGNMEEAIRVGNSALAKVFQSEITSLIDSRDWAEKTDFEALELNRFIEEDLCFHNPILKKAIKAGAKELEFGKKLVALNLLDYPVKNIGRIDDFEKTMDIAISLKQYSFGTTLDESIEEKEGLIIKLEAEQKIKYGYKKGDGGFRLRKTNSEIHDFDSRQRNIEKAKKDIELIKANRELLEMAIANDPYQVRQPQTKPQPKIKAQIMSIVESNKALYNADNEILENLNTEQAYTTGWLEALKPVCGVEDWHTALKGVLVDGDQLVASNGHCLVKILGPRFKDKSGKILDPSTAEELVILDEKGHPVVLTYPNYARVIQIENTKTPLKFADIEIKKFLYTQHKKEFYASIAFVKSGVGDLFTCDYDNLFNAITVLEKYGAGVISFRYTGPKEALMIYADNGNFAVIQPMIERVKESDITTIELEVISKEEEEASLSASPKSHISLKQIQQTKPQIVQKTLSIDIETYSPVDLKKSGLYAYVEHPEFEILLFAYAFNNDPITVIDLALFEDIPSEVLEALPDPNVLKTAHNANFERICISKYLGKKLPIDQWECTMIKSAMVGLPFSLDAVGKVLKLDKEKMSEGKALLRYFSIPCKPTKVNGERTRNFPHHDLEKWNTYKRYNGRDVEAEREIKGKISFFNIPETEKDLYILDQVINDRGVMIDQQFVDNAIQMDATYKDRLTVEMTDLTDLNNPNSVSQLKAWLSDETGEDVTSLTKEAILTMLKNTPSEEVAKVLKNRQEMAKTSVKKYQAMKDMVCADGRIRGLAQFYGANRTGRWAGRGVQLQNLPQNHLNDLDLARQLVSANDLELLEMLFGNVPDTLSQLIRTAFVPKPGSTFFVADFSAIEARVIAWLAEEKWRLDVFATHGKIYEASAAQMFKVPIEEVTKGSSLRQKGKVAELALGYQGGPGALEKMGALKMGLQEDELQGLVDAWRAANPNIVRLWKDVDNASKEAVEDNTITGIRHGIKFEGHGNIFYIQLPSGRKLSYWKPKFGKNKFGSDSLIYEGMNQTTKQWGDQETYGGKLVENIVQAIARDCLAYTMLSLEKVGFKIVFHVHDEVIIEIEEGKSDIKEVCKIMGQPIPWAKGLQLTADGYETKYYRKD